MRQRDVWINGLVQCRTCGVERGAENLPALCPICADERQYLPPDGKQIWVEPADQQGEFELVRIEDSLWGLNNSHAVGIGQQAKVIVTDQGCVMVDPPAAITEQGVRQVRGLGQMLAIIATHPHMFGLQSAWSTALGDVPVFVAEADAHWLGATPAELRLWTEDFSPAPGVTAFQPGGHFPGSAAAHWVGADGRGVLLSGDTIAANPDGTAAFMRSYPNRIPLSGAVARRVAESVARFRFDRLYDNFTGTITTDARAAVLRSAHRHANWTSGVFDHLTGPGSVPPASGPHAGMTLRITHEVNDLRQAEEFWVAGVGLEVQWRSGPHHELALLMVGPPAANWHLELIEDEDARAAGTDDGLVILYARNHIDAAWTDRIEAHGGVRVPARNPYWDESGVSIQAPSGHRLVLTTRTWPATDLHGVHGG